MSSLDESSELERNYLIALERTATYHNRIRILKKAFRKWAIFQERMTPLREGFYSMWILRSHNVKQRYFSAWEVAVRDAQEESKKTELALTFHLSVTAARALESWKQYIKRKRQKHHKEKIALLFHNSYLATKYIHRWKENVDERLTLQRKTFTALIHVSQVTKAKMFRRWILYMYHKRTKHQENEIALKHLNRRLKRQYFSKLKQNVANKWKERLDREKAREFRINMITLTAFRVLHRYAKNRISKRNRVLEAQSILQERTAHRLLLNWRDVFVPWHQQHRAEKREREREATETIQRQVLHRIVKEWHQASKRRAFKRVVIGEAIQHHNLVLEAKALFVLRIHRTERRAKKEKKEKADSHRRLVMGRVFLSSLAENVKWKQQKRKEEEEAKAEYASRLIRTALTKWMESALQREKERREEAINRITVQLRREMMLAKKYTNKWRAFVMKKRRERGVLPYVDPHRFIPQTAPFTSLSAAPRLFPHMPLSSPGQNPSFPFSFSSVPPHPSMYTDQYFADRENEMKRLPQKKGEQLLKDNYITSSSSSTSSSTSARSPSPGYSSSSPSRSRSHSPSHYSPPKPTSSFASSPLPSLHSASANSGPTLSYLPPSSQSSFLLSIQSLSAKGRIRPSPKRLSDSGHFPPSSSSPSPSYSYSHSPSRFSSSSSPAQNASSSILPSSLLISPPSSSSDPRSNHSNHHSRERAQLSPSVPTHHVKGKGSDGHTSPAIRRSHHSRHRHSHHSEGKETEGSGEDSYSTSNKNGGYDQKERKRKRSERRREEESDTETEGDPS
ncbi:uncharacterized protein MONOS_4742 [Monocercomonoides exilis]|uniref:uncharacterized protein n=1 Tax=Monocercomonoides exilis TaxID=2049356 RepID=UPI0035596CD5|nr:hypothetical protein MONOS_4742 [Monocercomonoides exilis]|eukprot:MONOS_4742.1-p1 / transcript=MONOS_4742.1 / gene=MONOS_4742 / organism=Monocercomonoides_exilis_PA203 / gene_product=unspecified product / transcript_product=unspecified product / location=Mono_scaffold00130:50430-53213(+) / protein_length=791 / sequence_SO=supercontig / SO=protein_coding / is_pseudo=false